MRGYVQFPVSRALVGHSLVLAVVQLLGKAAEQMTREEQVLLKEVIQQPSRPEDQEVGSLLRGLLYRALPPLHSATMDTGIGEQRL